MVGTQKICLCLSVVDRILRWLSLSPGARVGLWRRWDSHSLGQVMLCEVLPEEEEEDHLLVLRKQTAMLWTAHGEGRVTVPSTASRTCRSLRTARQKRGSPSLRELNSASNLNDLKGEPQAPIANHRHNDCSLIRSGAAVPALLTQET